MTTQICSHCSLCTVLEMLSWMNIAFFKYILRFMVSEMTYETGLWSLLVFWFVLLTYFLVYAA